MMEKRIFNHEEDNLFKAVGMTDEETDACCEETGWMKQIGDKCNAYAEEHGSLPKSAIIEAIITTIEDPHIRAVVAFKVGEQYGEQMGGGDPLAGLMAAIAGGRSSVRVHTVNRGRRPNPKDN